MNILFVNYGDFTTNSLNHIGGFANTLCAAGHACVVAVPSGKDTLSYIANPLFIAATYDELLGRPKYFPNGKPADLIHAWTPREGVRKFREVAKGFLRLEVDVSHVLTSPLLRARQTAEVLAETFARKKQKVDLAIADALAPPGHLRALLSHLRQLRAPAAIAVGHEPTLSEFLGQLCFAAPGHCEFKKGAIAALDLADNFRHATLLSLLQPAHLRALA